MSERAGSEHEVLYAPAKLTVSLRVTGVRADGYHLLDAEMVNLDLHDILTVDESGDGLAATGPFARGMPLDGENLVSKALEASHRRAYVVIDKRIPHGGGLGGGSADAAAILRWAGVTDPATAARIGADVPFCVIGGHARVRGIGELVERLPHVDRTITLVIPPLSVSTPAVYRVWDELGGPRADGPNDLEPAALAVEPGLRRWRDAIGDACGVAPVLAGSGATWFVEGKRDDALAVLVGEGARVVVARTIGAPGR
jgi:4-diphosphocytidyl-2-C-methyl-D-erythritol kinase